MKTMDTVKSILSKVDLYLDMVEKKTSHVISLFQTTQPQLFQITLSICIFFIMETSVMGKLMYQQLKNNTKQRINMSVWLSILFQNYDILYGGFSARYTCLYPLQIYTRIYMHNQHYIYMWNKYTFNGLTYNTCRYFASCIVFLPCSTV